MCNRRLSRDGTLTLLKLFPGWGKNISIVGESSHKVSYYMSAEATDDIFPLTPQMLSVLQRALDWKVVSLSDRLCALFVGSACFTKQGCLIP